VGVYGMADYRIADYRFPGSSGPPALVLGYGRLAPKAIEAGVRRLAQELQGAGQTSGC
jgi:DNA-binding transcriptional MocR family regulator